MSEPLYVLKSKEGYYYGYFNYLDRENVVMKTKVLHSAILFYKREIENAKKIILHYDSVYVAAIPYEVEKANVIKKMKRKIIKNEKETKES